MKKIQQKKIGIQGRMLEVLDEIAILTDEYKVLRAQLHKLTSIVKQERVYSEYMDGKIVKNTRNRYDIVALEISAFLKEKGVPVQTKEIFDHLSQKEGFSISYVNLQSNYLPRIKDDRKINVERAMRGYWQYRVGCTT